MPDAQLYSRIRKRLKEGATIHDIRVEFGKEHTYSDIDFEVKEFFRDEATNYDDKLIREIEKRLAKGNSSKGEVLIDIMSDLQKKGHKPYEIEKAILRAEVAPNMSLTKDFHRWNIYSWIQIGILISTVLLGIFFERLFFFATAFILFEMFLTTVGISGQYKKWKTDITVLPVGGFVVTQGVWGYNPHIGNYYRWWILEPSTVLSAFFVIFGFGSFNSGLPLEHTVVIFLICLVLAIFSWIAFLSTNRPGYIAE